MALAHIQDDPAYRELGLPYLKASPRLDAAALEHVVALYHRVRELSAGVPLSDAPPVARLNTSGARAANAALRDEMRRRDNYFEEIERVATAALDAVGYLGPGAVSERQLTDAAAHFGYTISRVQGMPRSARSITDTEHKTIDVPQRNATGGTRLVPVGDRPDHLGTSHWARTRRRAILKPTCANGSGAELLRRKTLPRTRARRRLSPR